MGRKLFLRNRFITTFVAFCFLANQIMMPGPIWAQSPTVSVRAPAFHSSSLGFDIPAGLGQLDELYIPSGADTSGKLIAFIQDAHANTQAQKSIEGILRKLITSFGPDTLVALEGAKDRLEPQNLQVFSDPKLNEALAQDLLEKGELTGAELFALKNPDKAQYIGVDSPELYRENIASYRKTYGLRPESLEWLSGVNTDLKELKNRLFTKELKTFDKARESFHKEILSTYDYLLYLSKWSLERAILDLNDPMNQKDFPILTRILALKRTASQISGFETKLKTETNALIKTLKEGGVSDSLISPLNDLSKSLPKGGSRQYFEDLFISSLSSKRPIDWNKYPTFRVFTEYSILQEEIDGVRFFKEIRSLEDLILSSLGLGDREKQALSLSQDTVILERLLRLEASKEELEYYTSHKDSLDQGEVEKRLKQITSQFTGFKHRATKTSLDPKKVEEAFRSAEDFYRFATLRDQALLTNTLRTMDTHKLTKAILITGGFHSQGIRRLLRDQKISYVLISPRIQSEFTTEKYERIMMGDITPAPAKTSQYQKVPAALMSGDPKDIRTMDPARLNRLADSLAVSGLEALVRVASQPDTLERHLAELRRSGLINASGDVQIVPDAEKGIVYIKAGSAASSYSFPKSEKGSLRTRPISLEEFDKMSRLIGAQPVIGASLGREMAPERGPPSSPWDVRIGAVEMPSATLESINTYIELLKIVKDSIAIPPEEMLEIVKNISGRKDLVLEDLSRQMDISYYAEGTHKYVFKVTLHLKNKVTVPFLIALKKEKEPTDITGHELNGLKKLKGRGVPKFGGSFAARDGRVMYIEEFIPGPTANALKRKGMMTDAIRKSIVSTLVGISLIVGMTPRDFHDQNFIIREGTNEAVMVDIGGKWRYPIVDRDHPATEYTAKHRMLTIAGLMAQYGSASEAGKNSFIYEAFVERMGVAGASEFFRSILDETQTAGQDGFIDYITKKQNRNMFRDLGRADLDRSPYTQFHEVFVKDLEGFLSKVEGASLGKVERLVALDPDAVKLRAELEGHVSWLRMGNLETQLKNSKPGTAERSRIEKYIDYIGGPRPGVKSPRVAEITDDIALIDQAIAELSQTIEEQKIGEAKKIFELAGWGVTISDVEGWIKQDRDRFTGTTIVIEVQDNILTLTAKGRDSVQALREISRTLDNDNKNLATEIHGKSLGNIQKILAIKPAEGSLLETVEAHFNWMVDKNTRKRMEGMDKDSAEYRMAEVYRDQFWGVRDAVENPDITSITQDIVEVDTAVQILKGQLPGRITGASLGQGVDLGRREFLKAGGTLLAGAVLGTGVFPGEAPAAPVRTAQAAKPVDLNDPRSATDFKIEDMKDVKKQNEFAHRVLRWEAQYHRPGVAYNGTSGLTVDVQLIGRETGGLKGAPNNQSAASKEALQVSVLALAVSGNKDAQLFMSPDDPRQAKAAALELLRKKITSYEKFNNAYPGFGGFLPWFVVTNDGLEPAKSWEDRVPALDNGQLVWSLKAMVQALKQANEKVMADRVQKIVDLMSKNAHMIFYDEASGKLRGETKILDPKAVPKPANYVRPEKWYPMEDPHEGQMFVLFWSLYGNPPQEAVTKVWDGKRALVKRIEFPTSKGEITTFLADRGSSHERWELLQLPSLDEPLLQKLSRNMEAIRAVYSNDNKMPGFFAAAHLPETGDGVPSYDNQLGIKGVGVGDPSGADAIVPYAAFPTFFLSRPAALAWLLNMLKGPKGFGPFGASESLSKDGAKMAPVLTWDGKMTTVLALMGGTAGLTREALKADKKHDLFLKLLKDQYEPAFKEPLKGESIEIAFPATPVPQGADFGKGIRAVPGINVLTGPFQGGDVTIHKFENGVLTMEAKEGFFWGRVTPGDIKKNPILNLIVKTNKAGTFNLEIKDDTDTIVTVRKLEIFMPNTGGRPLAFSADLSRLITAGKPTVEIVGISHDAADNNKAAAEIMEMFFFSARTPNSQNASVRVKGRSLGNEEIDKLATLYKRLNQSGIPGTFKNDPPQEYRDVIRRVLGEIGPGDPALLENEIRHLGAALVGQAIIEAPNLRKYIDPKSLLRIQARIETETVETADVAELLRVLDRVTEEDSEFVRGESLGKSVKVTVTLVFAAILMYLGLPFVTGLISNTVPAQAPPEEITVLPKEEAVRPIKIEAIPAIPAAGTVLPNELNRAEMNTLPPIQEDLQAANNYSAADLKIPERRDKFVREMMLQEGRFHQAGIAYNAVTMLTYDGVDLDPETGEARGGPRNWSAASKESLHISMLIQALSGNENAAFFVSAADPKAAKEIALNILKGKVASYESFNNRFPGFGGFLPWYLNSDSGIKPTWDWETRVPALDNGEWIWSLTATVEVLNNTGETELAKRYQKLIDLMGKNAHRIFYDPEEGKVRAEASFEDPSAQPEAQTYKNNVAGYFLDDPYEGELFTLFWSLYADPPRDTVKKVWDSKRLERMDFKTAQGLVTIRKGHWLSSHEEWNWLELPYNDDPLIKQVFRNIQIARTHNSNEKKIPGLFASVHDVERPYRQTQYTSAFGVKGADGAKDKVKGEDTITPYSAFPVILADPEGLVWYLNMLQAPRMQGPYGSSESITVDGKSFAPFATWDAKVTTVLAMTGGIADINRGYLKRTGKYDEFRRLLGEKYASVFGREPLRGTDLGIAPPASMIGKGMQDFVKPNQVTKGVSVLSGTMDGEGELRRGHRFRKGSLTLPAAGGYVWTRTARADLQNNFPIFNITISTQKAGAIYLEFKNTDDELMTADKIRLEIPNTKGKPMTFWGDLAGLITAKNPNVMIVSFSDPNTALEITRFDFFSEKDKQAVGLERSGLIFTGKSLGAGISPEEKRAADAAAGVAGRYLPLSMQDNDPEKFERLWVYLFREGIAGGKALEFIEQTAKANPEGPLAQTVVRTNIATPSIVFSTGRAASPEGIATELLANPAELAVVTQEAGGMTKDTFGKFVNSLGALTPVQKQGVISRVVFVETSLAKGATARINEMTNLEIPFRLGNKTLTLKELWASRVGKYAGRADELKGHLSIAAPSDVLSGIEAVNGDNKLTFIAMDQLQTPVTDESAYKFLNYSWASTLAFYGGYDAESFPDALKKYLKRDKRNQLVLTDYALTQYLTALYNEFQGYQKALKAA